MRKTILLLLMVIGTILPAIGQTGNFDPKNIVGTRDMTMCVVLLDDDTSSYNADLKAAVEKYWTYSKFEFIQESEVLDKIENPGYTFLKLVSGEASSSASGGGASYTSTTYYKT